MTANDLVTLIGSLGFPIVMCGAMFWENHKCQKEMVKDFQKTAEKMSETVSANTAATNNLVTTVELLLKVGEHDG